jgi:hypothetical protein
MPRLQANARLKLGHRQNLVNGLLRSTQIARVFKVARTLKRGPWFSQWHLWVRPHKLCEGHISKQRIPDLPMNR